MKTLASLESALNELDGDGATKEDEKKIEGHAKRVQKSAIPRRHVSVSSRLGSSFTASA